MRSITFVQAFQYWLKLTAIAVPALALAALFLADPARTRRAAAAHGGPADHRRDRDRRRGPGRRARRRSLSRAPSTADPCRMRRYRRPASTRSASGSTLTLAAGAATPVVAGAPSTGEEWIRLRRRPGRSAPAVPGAVHHRRDFPRRHGPAARTGAVLHESGRAGRAAHRVGRHRAAVGVLRLPDADGGLRAALRAAAADHRQPPTRRCC